MLRLGQLKEERVREAELEKRFFGYAKGWWKEYLGIRPVMPRARPLVRVWSHSHWPVSTGAAAYSGRRGGSVPTDWGD